MATKSELSFRTKFLLSLGLLALLTSCVLEPSQATWTGDYCEGSPCQPNSATVHKTGSFPTTEDKSCPKKIEEKVGSIDMGGFNIPIVRSLYLKDGTCGVVWPPTPTPSPLNPHDN